MFERAPVFVGHTPRLPANAPPQPVGHAQPAQDFFKDQDREEALGRGRRGNITWVNSHGQQVKLKEKIIFYLP